MTTECTFPMAYVQINTNMDILFCNNVFKSTFAPLHQGDSLFKITDIFEGYDITAREQKTVINDTEYNFVTDVTIDGKTDVYIFQSDLKAEEAGGRIMAALLVLDNYTEIKENMEEVRHPHMMAVVDRKINEYFTELGGIVRKFEQDKYLFILREDQLAELKKSKFSIMEMISKIDMDGIPMSMSIGIGINGTTMSQCMEYARGAVDLALARGGAQVVVKEGEDKYQFIGGNGREISTNTGVRARMKAYGFVELIKTCTDVIVMGHKSPDLDSLGSCAGIFSICEFFGRKCHIVLGSVNSSISTLYKSLMDDNRYESVFIDGDTALKQLRRRTLVVVVDTHKKAICECPELVEKAKQLVVIDHHRKGPGAIEGYALTYHESFASSASELITEMLMYMNKGIRLTKTEAEGLLAGITVDTKNFAFKTSSMTFQAAAYLKQLGADTVAVRRLFQNTLDAYVAKAAVVRDAEIYNKNMAISVLRIRVDNPIVLIAQSADELLGIKGIEASFVMNEMDGTVYISARSLGRVNVQWIMEKMGGGGHQSGAAAQLKDSSTEDAIALLKQTIEEYLKQ
ncbi:MAG: DHH family phosphoesterase [Firmicutes bacterium]|nr:DHH family phosphoesterase [Bacillota bacterium]